MPKMQFQGINRIVSACKFFLLALPVFLCICSAAQSTRKLDSLKIVFQNAKIDTVKAHLAIQIGWKYTYVNIDSSFLYNRKAYEIAKRIQHLDLMATALNDIGIDYYILGKFKETIKYLDESYQLHKKRGNKYGMFQTKTNIGGAYSLLKQHDLGLKCFLDARDIINEMKRYDLLPAVSLNIASMYIGKKEIANVRPLIELAIDDSRKTNNKVMEATALAVYAQYFRLKNDLDSALTFFERSNAMLIEIDQEPNSIESLNNIAEIYIAKGNPEKALKYALKALELSKKDGLMDEMKTAYKFLSQIYEAKKEYKKAFDNLALYKQFSDSIYNSDNTEALSDIKTKFEVELKEKELNAKSEAEKMVLKTEAEAHQKRNQLILLSGISIIVIISIFSLVLLKKFKQSERQQIIIATQKKEVEKQYQISEARAFEIEIKNTELEIKNKEILDSINYAKNIQSALLPNTTVLTSSLRDHFILFEPKDIIAGDFYWVKQINKDEVYFAVGDCTGHGVPGALMSVLGMNLLESIFKSNTKIDPSEILNELREKIVFALETSEDEKSLQDGMDISLIYINFKEKKCLAAMANNPMLIIRDNKLMEFSPDKMPIGKSGSMERSFKQEEINLQKGDMIYLFTDGYRDQFGGEKGKKLKYRNFVDLLSKYNDYKPEEQQKALKQFLVNWRNTIEQTDDICVAGIRIS